MYSFKELPLSEIIQGFIAAKMEVTANTIQKPKPASITNLFTSYFMFLTNFNFPQISTPDFQLYNDFDEELAGGFAFLNCFLKLKEILSAAGVKDFSLKDLYAPTQARLIHLFSALMNFAIFEKEKLSHFSSMLKKKEELQNENQKLHCDIEAIQLQLKEASEKLKVQSKQMETLRSAQANLQGQISEFELAQTNYLNENEKLKQKCTEMQNEENQLHESIDFVANEINQLEEIIGLDPKMIDGIIQNANDQLASVEKDYAGIQKQYDAAKERRQFFDENSEKLLNAVEQCHPLIKDMKRQFDVQENARCLENEKRELEEIQKRIETLLERKKAIDEDKKKQASAINSVNQKIKAQLNEKKKLEQLQKNAAYDAEDHISLMRTKIDDYFHELKIAMNKLESEM